MRCKSKHLGAECSKWERRSTKVGVKCSQWCRSVHRPGKVLLQLLLFLQHCLFLGAQCCTFALQAAFLFLVSLEELFLLSPERSTFGLQAAFLFLVLIHNVLFLRPENRTLFLKTVALHLHGLKLTGCKQKQGLCNNAVLEQAVCILICLQIKLKWSQKMFIVLFLNQCTSIRRS